MFLTTEDFNTTLYDEIIDAVSREDETIILAAIDAAISEAKGYLYNYDVEAIFAKTKKERHPLLLTFLKDMAVWHFLAVGNPSADLEMRKSRYDSAIKWLRSVQSGDIQPDLPRPDPSGDETGGIGYGSNPKRENHY